MMNRHTHPKFFSNAPTGAIVQDAENPEDWPPYRSSVAAPSISQLAHTRAQNLDRPLKYKKPGFDISYNSYAFDNDIEKRYDDPTPLSLDASSDPNPDSDHPQPEQLPLQVMSRKREFAFIFITCIAQFLSLGALNQTVAPVMVLADHFDIEDYGTLSWFSASFSMSVGTFILPAGKILFYASQILPIHIFVRHELVMSS